MQKKTTIFSISLPDDDLLREIDQAATRLGLSRSKFMAKGIKHLLQNPADFAAAFRN